MNSDIAQLKDIAQELSVLYVEDEEKLRDGVSSYLSKFFKIVDVASNGKEGLEYFRKFQYDLIITDINMPLLSGLDMAKEIKKINENQNILIVSAYSDTQNFIESIKIGIDGYILKPIEYNQLNTELYKTTFKIKQFKESIEYKSLLEQLIETKTEDVKELQKQKIYNYKNTLYALVKMVEDRDTYTGGHSLRVAKYSKLIAQNLNLDEETCENIYEAGILHDIGKIAIPDNVLLKPGSLNDLEYTLIQEHVNLGVKMLSKVPMFKELAKFIDGHHERLDGSGYPKGLKGEQIALESQIMAISDAFDAMTTSRIYKARKSIPEALNELESLSGKHYSEDVTKSAITVLKDIIIDNNISQLPTTQIEKERFSYFYKDQTTQSYNSNYLDLVLRQNSYDEKYKYLYIISIHNLNQVNITYGWEQGSEFLKDFYQKLKNIFSEYNIFRVFSDDFIILSDVELNIDREVIQSCISKREISFDIQTYDIVKEKIDSIQSIDILQ